MEEGGLAGARVTEDNDRAQRTHHAAKDRLQEVCCCALGSAQPSILQIVELSQLLHVLRAGGTAKFGEEATFVRPEGVRCLGDRGDDRQVDINVFQRWIRPPKCVRADGEALIPFHYASAEVSFGAAVRNILN